MLHLVLLGRNVALSFCLLHQVLHGGFQLLILSFKSCNLLLELILLFLYLIDLFLSPSQILTLLCLVVFDLLLHRLHIALRLLILLLKNSILFFLDVISHLHLGRTFIQRYELFL